jgi:hypothetical protein
MHKQKACQYTATLVELFEALARVQTSAGLCRPRSRRYSMQFAWTAAFCIGLCGSLLTVKPLFCYFIEIL